MTHKAKPFDIPGVDPLQALVLAIAYLDVEFGVLMRNGWRFYLDPASDEPFDPAGGWVQLQVPASR